MTTFGGPHDVTLSELAVESFFPADAATRARLHAAARASVAAMSDDWRTAGVRVIPGDALDTNTPQTPGMHRAAAVTRARAGAERLWAGTVTIHPGARTGAHHHGELESVIYVVRGKARMRWGERLEFTAEAGPGGFIFVPPFVPHQRRCPSRRRAAAGCVPENHPSSRWPPSTRAGQIDQMVQAGYQAASQARGMYHTALMLYQKLRPHVSVEELGPRLAGVLIVLGDWGEAEKLTGLLP